MGKLIKREKGITLIALVITIIVLLILAGVGIATLTGENGIITQAMKAKEETEVGEEKEQIELAYISSGGKINLGEIKLENLQKELENKGYQNTVTKEKDASGKKGVLVKLTKKDRYYFIENKKVRKVSKEEFSKEITPMYAILYSDGDLRFNTTGNIDETKNTNGVTVVLKSDDISNTRLSYSGNNMPWASKNEDVKTVTIEEKIVLKYGTAVFANLTNLEKINGIEKIFTDNVPAMRNMFINCHSLKELDLSGFNTSNVTDFSYMFQDCNSLVELDISSFDVSEATNIGYMFKDCTSLAELDISSFNILKVKSMDGMFYNCTSLIKLDLSDLKTSNNLISMSEMFKNCSKITKLDLSGFNTSNVTDFLAMFENCSSLTELDISSFEVSNATKMSNMFFNCSSLTKLDVSGFKTSNKLTKMSETFRKCSKITELNLSGFDTSNVTTMYGAIRECSNLKNLTLSDKFVCTNVTNMEWMFHGSSSLAELDLSSFKETKATSLTGMFNHMTNLKKLDISNLDTKNVTNIMQIFYQCRNLEILDMRSATFNNVTTYDNAFNLESPQLEGKIIAKDNESKSWIQNNLMNAGKTKVVTPSEL